MSPKLCAHKFTVRPCSFPSINALNAPDFKVPFLFKSFTEFMSRPGFINWDLFVPPGENRSYSTILLSLRLFSRLSMIEIMRPGQSFFSSSSFIFLPQTHSMRETNGGEDCTVIRGKWWSMCRRLIFSSSARSPFTG